ncbi:hypothetical protein F5I97DRAFT_1813161 [Phlebopus sp. FC_14]|nr:hypothetical protein F5I97DRAFT_1813161 [Phlebopus sp. FC_14]
MSDDFFSNVPFAGQSSSQGESVDSFAHAIAARFGSADLLTAKLLPGEISQNQSRTPSQQQLNSHEPQSPLTLPPPVLSLPPILQPSALASYIADPSTLILDIRPHAAHASARLHHALSLSVPSTLLKRPLFSLSKLSQMLPSASARARFAAWPNAARILVYDADSALTPDNSNIAGLLRKFRAEGFSGDLGWVRGGFQAVWREAREFATTEPPSPEEDDSEALPAAATLRTKHLPKAAFSLTSTATGAPVGNRVPQTPTSTVSLAANPFFDTIRQNVELSQGITERLPLRLPRHVRRRIHDLPFRWLQDIVRKSAVRRSTSARSCASGLESESESSDDPHTSDPDENDPDIDEGAEALAMQFYRIELAEQRRLRTIMEHHSRESETAPTTPHPTAFPFSITAGVEKGTKNRYNHIWPFEHARVRLHDGQSSPVDDYVNASYVQPLGTRKRYIATQGPLPATYVDFWTLVWEQNVHVIVMLTREVENAMVKCGSYWTDTHFGPLRLELLSTSASASPLSATAGLSLTDPSRQGFFFSLREPPTKNSAGKDPPTTITRTFALSHTSYPGVPPRTVTHLQFLDWPDMNVPDDPNGVLDLVARVERAVAESTPGPSPSGTGESRGWRHPELDAKTGVAAFALGRAPPVLLHCSAGVGRTGGFIAVDAVLDAVRREMRKKREAKAARRGMDVEMSIESRDEGSIAEAEGTSARMDMVGTVPLHISAGEHKKGRKHHHGAISSGRKESSSSESLVVHVPLAVTEGTSKDGSTANMQLDASNVHWQSSSTREWVEQVSDQTHAQVDQKQPTSSISELSTWRVEESPASLSSGSGPSTLNSVDDPISGSASAAEISFFGIEGPSKSISRTSSGHTSDELTSPPQEFESGASADMEGSANESRKSSQVLSDESEQNLDTQIIEGVNVPIPKVAPTDIKAPNKVGLSVQSILRVPEAAENQQRSTIVDDSGVVEADQRRAVGQSVIDYKLPRELHTDLSPPLLSSFADPICTIIQDMREQRMSLCQSLRQYVFVHAAVVEGALRIVDEERELWGDSGGSDEGGLDPEMSAIGGQLPPTTASSSSGASSSPSKGKRGPSPTELLKEDKTGALLLNKRPSFKRKLSGDANLEFPFNVGTTAPMSGRVLGAPGAGVGVTLSVGGTLAYEGSDPSGTAR